MKKGLKLLLILLVILTFPVMGQFNRDSTVSIIISTGLGDIEAAT